MPTIEATRGGAFRRRFSRTVAYTATFLSVACSFVTPVQSSLQGLGFDTQPTSRKLLTAAACNTASTEYKYLLTAPSKDCSFPGNNGCSPCSLYRTISTACQCAPSQKPSDQQKCCFKSSNTQFSVLKAYADKLHWLVLPSQAVSGLENYKVLGTVLQKDYFDYAWALVVKGQKANLPQGTFNLHNTVLGVNGPHIRSKHQMHCHIARLDPSKVDRSKLSQVAPGPNFNYNTPVLSGTVGGQKWEAYARFVKATTKDLSKANPGSLLDPFPSTQTFCKTKWPAENNRYCGLMIVPTDSNAARSGFWHVVYHHIYFENFALLA